MPDMPMPRRRLSALGLALCLMGASLAATAQSAPAPLELTQSQLLDLAARELAAGRAQVALDLVEGLLATRPNVYDAHLIRTDALSQLGRSDEVLTSARAAWRETTSDAERTRVARLAAYEAYRDGKYFQSKFWLRRALNTAQTQNEKRNIIRNYNEIRRYDPWTTQFSFAMSPSSNVNNGAQGDVYSVDGLPWVGTVSPGSQALSGYRVSLSGTARYRWRFDNGSALSAGVRAYNTVIKFSSEAKAAAPTAEESDYDFGGLEVLLGGSKSLSKTHGLQWDLSVGRLFSGREAYSDVIRITVSDHYALKSGGVFSHSLEARKEFAIDPTRDGSEGLKYTLNLSKPFKGRGTLYSSAFVEQVFSDSISTARQRGGLSATFAPSKPVFGTKANFTLGAEMTRYPDYPFLAGTYVPGGRRDKSLYGSAGFTLINQSYFGFAPEIRINLGRTWSNVSRFDTRTSSIGLGIKSAF